MTSSQTETVVVPPQVKPQGVVLPRRTKHAPADVAGVRAREGEGLLLNHGWRMPSESETKRESEAPNLIRSRRRVRCFESSGGDDPHTINFPFAFSVTLITLAGFTFAVAGAIVTSAGLFFLGLLVVLLGVWLYGWSLREEES